MTYKHALYIYAGANRNILPLVRQKLNHDSSVNAYKAISRRFPIRKAERNALRNTATNLFPYAFINIQVQHDDVMPNNQPSWI